MPLHDFTFHLIISTLENETQLGRVLFYPEVSDLDVRGDHLRKTLWELTAEQIDRQPLLEFHRRSRPGPVDLREFVVEVEPPSRIPHWTTPVSLRFHAVTWRHGEAAAIAYVPALDIEVVARTADELAASVEREIRVALMRAKANTSLRRLAWLARRKSVEVVPVTWGIEVRTPKQIAQQRQAAAPESALEAVATDLAKVQAEPVFGMESLAQRLAERLWGSAPQSVLLVGPSGVGKTALVHKLAAGKPASPCWSTSGSRIVAGMCGFGMWQQRCQAICAEAARTKAVVHFGNLVELMQVGKSTHNDQGVGDFLRPLIARGDFLAIAECTPEQLAAIERESPSMHEAFARFEIKEPSPEESQRLLEKAAAAWASGRIVVPQAIATLDRLHRRYATYSAFPGRPLRFLRNLLNDAASGKDVLRGEDVTTAFSYETGLPSWLLEPSARLDLQAAHAWFAERVIGQEQAVSAVVDLLATVKAELARPGRPIASLLFIGPTGVGKTEMAKALAEFLYQDRRRMTRIDMSEYADPAAAERLIGGGGREGLLTSKVREQPFGVVLLDEFEKAHPRLFDLLLQVLGEGRLTDATGRLADFRNSVIIMTSNLGVDSFGRAAAGFAGPSAASDAPEHFAREVERFLRPEMFNRIDRIITFVPLEKATLRQIARRELGLLERRDGIRYRDLRLQFAEGVVDAVVEHGYDPRYGARPIKRAVARYVLAPLAARLNDYAGDLPLAADIDADGTAIRAAVRAVARGSGSRRPAEIAARQDLAELSRQCVALRRAAGAVDGSRPLVDLRNEVYRLEKAEKHIRARRTRALPGMEGELAVRLATVRSLIARAESVAAATVALEESALLGLYCGKDLDMNRIERELPIRTDELAVLRQDLYCQQFGKPDYATLVVYGEQRQWMIDLAAAYRRLFTELDYKVQAYWLLLYDDTKPLRQDQFKLGDRDSSDEKLRRQANGTRLMAQRMEGSDLTAAEEIADLRGIAFCLGGRLAWARWSEEAGRHGFKLQSGKDSPCLVHVSQTGIAAYQPPEKIDRMEGIGGHELRRSYDEPRQSIDDRRLGQRQRWSGDLADVVGLLVEKRLSACIDAWFADTRDVDFRTL